MTNDSASAPGNAATGSPGETVIIGGGPAGLTAAYELSKLGRPSVVLEQDDMVGGISRTVVYRGYRFDIGGHRFFTKVPYVQELWQELLDEEFLLRPRLSRIFYDGKFFDYPLRPMGALKGLGPVEAVRIGLSYIRSTLFPHDPERNFEEWVSNRFGTRLFEIFFKTYTEKVWGMPCSEISADWAAQRIKNLDLVALVRDALLRGRGQKEQITTLIEEFQYPRHGPGQMWETCVERLAERGVRTELETEVDEIVHDGSRVLHVSARGASGESRSVRGEHFVSSMPVRTLLRCMRPAPPAEVMEAANSLRYRDFLTVGLIVDQEELFPDNWIYIHTPDVKLGRIQNFKNWSPHMVPDPATSSLGLEYFVQQGDELWDADDDALIELGTRECEHLGLIPKGSVLDGTVIRMPKAYPVYDDAYQRALETIRAWLEGFPNLHLVGRNGQHRYNNQDHSMVTAVYAARNIAAGERIHDVWNVNVEESYHEEKDESAPAGDDASSRLAHVGSAASSEAASGSGASGAPSTPSTPSTSGERLVPRRVDEAQLVTRLRSAFARYDAVALGSAVGVVVGAWLFLLTVTQLVRPAPRVGGKLTLLANYVPHYDVSWLGAVAGTAEIMLGGFVFGWILAKMINVLILLEERRILARIESRALDLFDSDE